MAMSIWLDNQFIKDVDTIMKTENGREKTMRLIQFGAKFYRWYLNKTGGSALAVKQATTIYGLMSNSRKVARFWKPFRSWWEIQQLMKASQKGYDWWLQLVQKLMQLAYLLTDHGLFMKRMFLWNPTDTFFWWFDWWNNAVWVIDMSISVLRSAIALNKLAGDTSEGAEAKRAKERKTILKMALDIPIAFHFMEQNFGFGEGIFGAMGVAGTLISFQEMWPAPPAAAKKA